MQNTIPTDKICLDISDGDDAELAEKLTRLSPGDKITGSFEAKLESAGDGRAVLSITSINLKTATKANPEKSKAAKMFSENEPAKEEVSVSEVEKTPEE